MLSTNLTLMFPIPHLVISLQAPTTMWEIFFSGLVNRSDHLNLVCRPLPTTYINGLPSMGFEQGACSRLVVSPDSNRGSALFHFNVNGSSIHPKMTMLMITNILICRPIPRSNTGVLNMKLVTACPESVLGPTNTHKCPLSTMAIHS